jgi:hypothetical protein
MYQVNKLSAPDIIVNSKLDFSENSTRLFMVTEELPDEVKVEVDFDQEKLHEEKATINRFDRRAV